ncbi:MAG TPA: hypothetical protein GXX35_03220 [Thermoanaerobacterales bacterium]|nr:hypothetical protein [Thermoanaerobacterales bacterium]
MSIVRAMFEIMYSYPKLEVMDEYFDTKALLINTANDEVIEDISTNGKTSIPRWVKQLSSTILGNRQIINGLRTNELTLPEPAVNLLKGVVVTDRTPEGNDLDGVYGYFPLQGFFKVVIKKQRGAIFEAYISVEGMKTAFKLRSSMAIYGDEEYSIAFRTIDNSFGFALMYAPSIVGAKGKNMVKVSYFDNYTYYIDDASKYIDVRNFGKGLD